MHDGMKCGKKTQVQGHCDCIVKFLHNVDYLTEKEQIMHVRFEARNIHCSPITDLCPALIESVGFKIFR